MRRTGEGVKGYVAPLTLGKIAGVSEKRMVGKISHQKGKHLQIDGIAKWLLSSS
jgi:hypothetical protein